MCNPADRIEQMPIRFKLILNVVLIVLAGGVVLAAGIVGVKYLTPDSDNNTSQVSTKGVEKKLVPESPPEEINVLSYNVFFRPGPIRPYDYTYERAEKIGEWMADSDLDIVAIQEAWNSEAVSTVLEKTADSHPYYAADQPPRGEKRILSGGLILLSKWPITEKRVLEFDDCYNDDCYVTKGALHAVVQISENYYLNVVNTHLESESAPGDLLAREAQIDQLAHFVSEIDETTGPIIIAGDFNIDYLGSPEDYQAMVSTLGVEDYIVEDVSTKNCNTEDAVFCEKPLTSNRLDYIFLKSGENRLSRKETVHLSLETDEIEGGVRYLSDHRAVEALFYLRNGLADNML